MSDKIGPPVERPFYAGPEAGDFTVASDPFALFESWYAEAVTHEPNDPDAMALATVDRTGTPNARMVLLKDVDPIGRPVRGFVFYTNFESVKAEELIAAPKAALLFHWKSLRRQVRIRGAVHAVEPPEADAYFESRPRGSQIGAWASRQSRLLVSRRALETAFAAYEAKFTGMKVPRPPHWSGCRLAPVEIEFWHDRPFRLHDRVVFRRARPELPWEKTRLFP